MSVRAERWRTENRRLRRALRAARQNRAVAFDLVQLQERRLAGGMEFLRGLMRWGFWRRVKYALTGRVPTSPPPSPQGGEGKAPSLRDRRNEHPGPLPRAERESWKAEGRRQKSEGKGQNPGAEAERQEVLPGARERMRSAEKAEIRRQKAEIKVQEAEAER